MTVGTRDVDEAVVAVSGDLYVAPVGTPLPALVRAGLHFNFYKLGLVSTDGVFLTVAPVIDEHDAWQQANPIRFELAEQRIAVRADLLQWNAETVIVAFAGGTVTEFIPDQFRYDFPANDDDIVERSLVVDWEDGDRAFRLVFARCTVLGGLATTFSRSAMALLPVGFDALAVDETGSPGYMFLSANPLITPPPPDPDEEFPLLGDGLLGDGLLGGGS